MQTTESNISVKITRSTNQVFLLLKIDGELRHDDYIELTEQLDSTLNDIENRLVTALVDITELESWVLDGGWEDLQLGFSRYHHVKKIAIIGNQNWQRMLSQVGDWFVAADVHYFEDKTPAIHWLTKF